MAGTDRPALARTAGRLAVAAASILAAALAALPGGPRGAAADGEATSFHVTVAFDGVDAAPGDGACEVVAGGGGWQRCWSA